MPVSIELGTDTWKHSIEHVISYQDLVLDASDDKIPCELLYGRAGYLYTLLLLIKRYPSYYDQLSELIQSVFSTILTIGIRTAKDLGLSVPVCWLWHNKLYIGAAHGTSGILTILISALEYVNNDFLLSGNIYDCKSLIKQSADWVLELQDKDTENWPSSLSGNKYGRLDLWQWCHGAPGNSRL